MNNEDIFNLGSAFLVNTALLVGFILVILLSSGSRWKNSVTLDEAPTLLNSFATLLQNK